MKKVIVIASATIISALALVSCNAKKDWICTCSITGMADVRYPIVNANKSDADKLCEGYNNSINGTILSCKLD